MAVKKQGETNRRSLPYTKQWQKKGSAFVCNTKESLQGFREEPFYFKKNAEARTSHKFKSS